MWIPLIFAFTSKRKNPGRTAVLWKSLCEKILAGKKVSGSLSVKKSWNPGNRVEVSYMDSDNKAFYGTVLALFALFTGSPVIALIIFVIATLL